MAPRSLFDMATSACIKNIRHIDSVGDFLPYESVRRVLLRVENANQLSRIEENSPHVVGHTTETWLKIIEKDFPMEYKATAYKPSDPKNWYKIWKRYKKEHDKALAESEAKLKEALGGLQGDKLKNSSIIIDNKFLPKLHKKKRNMGPKDNSTSTLRFGSGSRTKTTNGASVMRKVRREVSEISRIHGSLLSRPGAKGGVSNAVAPQPVVRRAPQSMVNDRRRAAQPAFRTKAKPEPPTAVQEYEKRAKVISESDDDYGDDDDDDWGASSSRNKIAAPSIQSRNLSASTRTRPVESDTTGWNTPPKKKGKGLLSNNFKPNVVKRVVTQGEGSRARAEAPVRERDQVSRYEPKPTHRATQDFSPPTRTPGDRPSPPPPMTNNPSNSIPRKRKAVSMFMKPNKR